MRWYHTDCSKELGPARPGRPACGAGRALRRQQRPGKRGIPSGTRPRFCIAWTSSLCRAVPSRPATVLIASSLPDPCPSACVPSPAVHSLPLPALRPPLSTRPCTHPAIPQGPHHTVPHPPKPLSPPSMFCRAASRCPSGAWFMTTIVSCLCCELRPALARPRSLVVPETASWQTPLMTD